MFSFLDFAMLYKIQYIFIGGTTARLLYLLVPSKYVRHIILKSQYILQSKDTLTAPLPRSLDSQIQGLSFDLSSQ